MSVKKHSRASLGVLIVSAVAMSLSLVTAGPAAAAGTTLFSQTFADNTPSGTGAVVLPPGVNNGFNSACLTATGNASTGALRSCPTSAVGALTVNDPPGSGALSLTPLQMTKTGGVFAATSVPTVSGLDVSFTLNQYGGPSGGADGMTFALSAVNPAFPVAPPNLGYSGGSLGYSAFSSAKGLSNGYLGFGFDVFGNFSSTLYQGSGCSASTYQNGTNKVQGQVLIKGPGNNTTGYCPLNGTGANAATTTPPVVALHKTTRANSAVPVRIIINSSKLPVTPAAGLTTAAESYLLAFTPIGGVQQTLTGLLPVMSSTLVGSPTWLDADGLPKQLAFGWVGSTGSIIDNHEVSNVNVVSLNSVTRLTVDQVNYSAPVATSSTPLPTGSPAGYVVTPGVAAGLPESGTVTVTETVPTGVVPLAATGTGWVCGTPSGQSISCSNSNGPFAAGSTLPTVTVSALVTGTAVTQQTLQTSSVVTASSDLSDPAYSTSNTTGSNPTAPAVTSVSPTSGLIAGGTSMTISGTNLTGATSIQIGTAAEFTAGTVSTLTPCVSVAAPGCFTVSAGTLVISSLPGHAVGAVIVRVANLGASSDGAYSYMSVPGTPVVTAFAGVTSAFVSWSGSDGGSPITGFAVTPVRNGIAQTAVAFAAGTTSASFPGLTAAASYTFRVTATNANGTGPIGTSAAVVPYSVPAAPGTPTAVVSTGQAIVSWPTPSANGSPITGYTVTPYLGATAQTPQVFASTALTQTITGLTAGSAYTFTVKATNAAGTGPESAKSSAVTPNAPPTLALPTPVPGEVGAPYSSVAFTAVGGTAPFSWSIESGAPPAGLTLSAAGVISGTPTASGTASFTVKVTDAAGKTFSQPLTLTIAPAPVLANPAAPGGQVGVAYSNQLAVQAGTGTGPFGWAVSAGNLPPGITLGVSSGLLSGTPTTSGLFAFTVRVTDAQAQSATQAFTSTVNESPSLSFPAPPAGQVAVPYSRQLVVTGGTGPYAWSTTGTSPPGLTLNSSTGLLSGTPTTAGPYPFVVRVLDSTGQSATQPVTLTIAASPSLTFTPPAGQVGVPYSATPVLSGGTGPFSYSISAGTLPAGLTLNPVTGAISGTPSAATISPVTVRVSDGFAKTATADGTVVIVPAPTLTLPTPPVGDVGLPYSDQLTVNGGTAPFTWSITSGTLQAGLSLNPSTGLLSGIPTGGGTSTVTVTVTDGFGSTASQQLTVVVRLASTVSLASSVASTTPGGSVVLTATVGPGSPSGTVAFTDTITSGPQSGTSVPLGSVPVVAGTAVLTVPLSSFGSHHLVTAYTGDAAQSPAASAPRIVEVVATPGSILVREFRLSGPAGPADAYIELANVSAQSVALAGFQLATSSGTVSTLPPDAPALPPGRSYLYVGSDFSLGTIAHPDATRATSLGSGGVSVRAPDSAATQTDAVGPDDVGYHLGAALPTFTGGPTAQYAWVRTQATSYLQNTQNNAADFALVSTTVAPVGGVTAMLGSPSPTGWTDPWLHTFVVRSALLDPGVAARANPNRIVVRILPGTPGSITVRRTLTNTTSSTATEIRIRLHSLSQLNGLNSSGAPGPIANLRAVNPPTPQSTVVVAGSPIIVQNLSLDPPANASPGGGLNSTYRVPLPPGGLPAGGTVSVSFAFAADSSGSWWFGYDVDTLGLD